MSNQRPPFPLGCVIRNIRNGFAGREHIVYASLYDEDGTLLISATLSYITQQLMAAGVSTERTAPTHQQEQQ